MPTFQYNLFADPLEDAVIAAFPQYEGSEIEYKSAKGGFPKSFWETYSAFANTEGGLIVLGVKEEDGAFTPDGLPAKLILKFRQDFFSTQNNRGKVSTDLLNEGQVRVLPVPDEADQYVLAFDIPRANREQMPVHIGTDPFSGTYKRRDEGDYRCDRDAVRRMIADSNADAPVDSKILVGFDFQTDIDQKSLQQYRQLMSSRTPTHPWLAEDDIGLLRRLGGYRRDRQTSKEGLTLAGLLMFGKIEAIQDNDCAPHYFPDYRETLSPESDIRWIDRLCPDGTWEANLFQFYRQVWPRISAGLPRPFQLKSGQRQDETPAHVALREAFINSLIHADYSAPSSLISIRQPQGFQFTNPGTLLVSMRQYYEGGTSICRNKALQRMFSLIGGAEQAGSGAGKIMSGWASHHWMRPYLDVKDQPDRVILELEMESILSAQAQELLQKAFGQRAETLFGDALTVLSIVAMEHNATHRSLHYRVGMHATDLSSLLRVLCRDGFLISSGRGSGTTYALREEAADGLSEKIGSKFKEVTGSPEKVASVLENVASPVQDVASSPQNLAGFPKNLASSLENLAGWDGLSKLQKQLLLAAAAGWHTPAELATATNRSASYLRSQVIPVLVTGGLLVRKHDEATHPHQAYRTVQQL
jgi:predicted HTH transcriptional regulator